MVKILKVEDVSPLEAEIDRLREVIEKNFAAPGTAAEESANTAFQQQARARIALQRTLERKLQFLQSKLESAWEYADKASEKRLAEAIEQTMLELGAIRDVPNVAPAEVVAKSEIGTDRWRGARALDTILHQGPIKKSELSDPLELDNSLGVRTQVRIKE